MKYWEKLLQDNSLEALLLAGAIAIAVLASIWLVRRLRLLTRLARISHTRAGEAVVDALNSTRVWLFLPLALYAGASVLQIPARLDRLLEGLAMVGTLALPSISRCGSRSPSSRSGPTAWSSSGWRSAWSRSVPPIPRPRPW